MNQAERFEEADAIGEWSSANLERIGLHMPDFSPIRPSAPCTRPLPTRAHQVTLSSSRITALCQSVEDSRLSQHLAANDICEANDIAARANVNDGHLVEAMAMVKDAIQTQIDSGAMLATLGDKLLAIFERIEDVAVECSWSDLASGVGL
jgi:hypothetical protein